MWDQAVEMCAQAMATDSPLGLGKDSTEWAGADMTRSAARRAFKQAGITANDVQVIELHDCFSANEVKLKIIVFFLYTDMDIVVDI